MTITYEWYNDDHTVIVWRFSGSWTWSEAVTAQTQINTMIDSVPDTTVHFILDLRQSRLMPIGSLHKIPELIRKRHPRRGYAIIFGANDIIIKLWQVFLGMIVDADKQQLFFVKTLHEAEAFLLARTSTDES